jgi:predicted ATP-grasp superfamily ATP-dependent carboligase
VRIFLHEFITSGALAGHPLPPSLLREGQAMRRAVADDLVAIGDVEVVSTRDERVPALDMPHLTERPVSTASTEAERFRALCGGADRILIIAPEIDSELVRRVAIAIEIAGPDRVWNSPSLIATASDKWTTYVRLRNSGVPTIETCLGASCDWRDWDRPIAKPRDGAGSQGVRRLSASDATTNLSDRLIVQPFRHGRWLSCTLLFFPDGSHVIFPPAEQSITEDGRFAYLGGTMPARCDATRVQSVAERAVRSLVDDPKKLIGPVGVDLVEDPVTGELLVCEVNPRFTTSYVAARDLSQTNLLAGLLNPEAAPPAWRVHRIQFNADGELSSPEIEAE